ncbi:MAG: hypothetical protein RLZZ361_1497 [Cyanobacteriota bacterium]|jgi:hypothetical protein
MPKPRKNENQDTFIARCIPELVREGREQGQAVAVCYSMWNEHSGKKGMHGDLFHDDDEDDEYHDKPKK